MQPLITVGAFRKELLAVPSDTEITFGSSRFRKLPLVFNTVEPSGENCYHIELSELEPDNISAHEPITRFTAGEILKQLEPLPDAYELGFGCDVEGNILQYKATKTVLSVVLDSDTDNRTHWRAKS